MLFAHLERILELRTDFGLRGPNGAHDEFLLAATTQTSRKLAKLIPVPSLNPASSSPTQRLTAEPPWQLNSLRSVSTLQRNRSKADKTSRIGNAAIVSLGPKAGVCGVSKPVFGSPPLRPHASSSPPSPRKW